MNRKTFMLAMVLTTLTVMNDLYGTEPRKNGTTHAPSEPWKCGDKVREIPTIELGGKCWMNANIGYSKYNTGAYYTWQEAVTVCDSIFGDGWTLPTKVAVDHLMGIQNPNWKVQLGGMIQDDNQIHTTGDGTLELVNSNSVKILLKGHYNWTSTPSGTSAYVLAGAHGKSVNGIIISCSHHNGWHGATYFGSSSWTDHTAYCSHGGKTGQRQSPTTILGWITSTKYNVDMRIPVRCVK